MGLDICVLKPEMLNDINPSDIKDSFLILSEYPELEMFSKFAFDKENEYFDLKKPVEEKGYSFEGIAIVSQKYGKDDIITFETKDGERFEIINPPIFKKIDSCLCYKEVGYQRKGANKRFYQDGIWDSDCVTDLKTLKEHWKKYFSNHDEGKGDGWGYGVELKLAESEMKKNFKKNIIDNFVEGETFVVYW